MILVDDLAAKQGFMLSGPLHLAKTGPVSGKNILFDMTHEDDGVLFPLNLGISKKQVSFKVEKICAQRGVIRDGFYLIVPV